MKKIFTLLAAATVLSSAAQITITQSDIGTLNTVVFRATDTVPTVLPGSAGANQTWNLSGMVQHSADTVTFATPAQTQFGSQFPSATMAVKQRGSLDFDVFGSLTSSALRIYGQGGDPAGLGLNVAFSLSPYETILDLPASYQNSFNEVLTGYTKFYLGIDPGIGFVIDTVQIRSGIRKSSVIDGWGSVTTPLSTYNALRQNQLRTQYDTIDCYILGMWQYEFFGQEDSNRVYTWWANGMAWPVAELTDAQDLGTITRASWISAPLSAVGVEEHQQASFSTYPNPANNIVYFSGKASGREKVMIFDMSGRLLLTETLRADLTGVDVQQLSSGAYMFSILDASGRVAERGKFTVAR